MILRLRTRLAALTVATVLGLVAAVSLTAAPAAPEPEPESERRPSRTHFDDLLAGHHPPDAAAPNDGHTSHQETP